MPKETLTPTGRELGEPAATLVESVDSKGLKHTEIHFDPKFRGHSTLTTGVSLIESFMSYPMVTGLVECSRIDIDNGRFAYPTGPIWTLKEVVRAFEQVGQSLGCRAALEVCYLGAMILQEAGETGLLQGCFSHGNLTPWRIALKGDGDLQVFGYGIPQVEMHDFVHGGSEHIDIDSIRYAPPERLEGQPEQPSSDTYSLTVIAHELITGRPLFTETQSKEMWESVRMAEGMQRMMDAKGIPSKVRKVLSSALIYDPDMRLSGAEYIESIGQLLDDPSIDGRTLVELMQRMNQSTGTSKQKLRKTATAAFTLAQLKSLAEENDSDEADDVDLAPAEEARWAKTTGRGRRSAAIDATEAPPRRRRRNKKKPVPEVSEDEVTLPPPEPEPESDEKAEKAETKVAEPSEEPPPPRRRRRKKKATLELDTEPEVTQLELEPAAEAPATPEEEPVEAPAEETPRRRRRRRASQTEEPSSEPVVEEPSEEAPKRRRRRSSPSAEAAPEAESTPTPPRRRRRRPTAEASAENAETSESTDTASDAEAKPRRRRRRPTKSDE